MIDGHRENFHESPTIPQGIIDALYIRILSEVKNLGKPDEDFEDASLWLVKALCQRKGFPIDRLEDEGHRYVLYPGPAQSHDYLQAIDLQLELIDWDEQKGSLSYEFCGRRRHDPVAASWKETVRLQASQPARAHIEERTRAQQARWRAAEEAERTLRNRHLPAALEFLRLHDDGRLPVTRLGALEPFLTKCNRWRLEPNDCVEIRLLENGKHEILHRRDGLVNPEGPLMDVIEI